MRLFSELCSSTFSYFPLLRASSDKDYDATLETFKDGLKNTNAFLKRYKSDGPFLLNHFSLAECNVAPFVQRCCTILPAYTGKENSREVVDPLKLCDELGLDRLKEWMVAVLAHPSVVATGVPESDLIESTARMLERFAAMASK